MYNTVKAKEAFERIREGIPSLYEKKRYKEYLECVSNFPAYSSNNMYLIYSQNKEATMVCGFKEWNKKGRHVMKGEKGIEILSPLDEKVTREKKDANGNIVYDAAGNPVMETVREFRGFRTSYVFDISQTAGESMPSITAMTSGKVDGFKEVFKTLQEISPCPIVYSENPDEIGFVPRSNSIVLNSDVSQQKTMELLLPSIASVLMSQDGCPHDYASLEAESAALIAAKHYGIDADYDFDYITDYSSGKELSELTESLKIIQKTAATLIKGLKPAFSVK